MTVSTAKDWFNTFRKQEKLDWRWTHQSASSDVMKWLILDTQFQKMELMQMPARLEQSLKCQYQKTRKQYNVYWECSTMSENPSHPKFCRDNKAIERIIEERDWLALEENTWGSSEQNKRITGIKKLLSIFRHIKSNTDSSWCKQIRNCSSPNAKWKACKLCIKITNKCIEELCNHREGIFSSSIWIWKISSICVWKWGYNHLRP